MVVLNLALRQTRPRTVLESYQTFLAVLFNISDVQMYRWGFVDSQLEGTKTALMRLSPWNFAVTPLSYLGVYGRQRIQDDRRAALQVALAGSSAQGDFGIDGPGVRRQGPSESGGLQWNNPPARRANGNECNR